MLDLCAGERDDAGDRCRLIFREKEETTDMAKTLAIINVVALLTKEQMKLVKKTAQKQLGEGFRVVVLGPGVTCQIAPMPAARPKSPEEVK